MRALVNLPDPTPVAWLSPTELRDLAESEQIEAQDAFSGRWRPIGDSYWDDCVIAVRWRRAGPLSFVSSVRLEVGWEVGIAARCETVAIECPMHRGVQCNGWAVVATSTISEAGDQWSCHVCGPHPGNRGNWCQAGCGRDYQSMNRTWFYTLAPLRECDPITDLPCRNPIHPSPGVSSWDECPTCSDALVVPLPEVPTGEVVLL